MATHSNAAESRSAEVSPFVGLCGNTRRPSKSRTLVEAVGRCVEERYGVRFETFDILDMQPGLGQTLSREQAAGRVLQLLSAVESAEVLVVGSPVYQGSYGGLFKHFIDLLRPELMNGKPIIITATGGGDRHALVVEHQLRPLFGFFAAHTIATAVYASEQHFVDGQLRSQEIVERIMSATEDLQPWLGPRLNAA
jgi:FMN reductase